MFQCRMCSENPFNGMFGGADERRGRDEMRRKKKDKNQYKNLQERHEPKHASRRNEASFQARTEEEILALVRQWEQYAHPRAREFFMTPERLEEVLKQLAKCIDVGDDPILGAEDKCVFWFGEVTKDEHQAAIRMVKPGENAESVTYVNRLLAFIFATNDSFEQLMRLPKEPFKMCCEDQLCVHLAHILLDV